MITDELERGRSSFERKAWGDAHAQLSFADRQAALQPDDLERLAMATFLIGKDADSIDLWTRAHHERSSRGEAEAAAMCAFRVGMILMDKGDVAQAGGWFARAGRVIDEAGLDCVVQGYLLVPAALRTLFFEGDAARAHATFEQMAGIAHRFGDADLMALSRLGLGRALLGMNRVPEGVAFLDEAMVAVTSGEVSPLISGIVYCATIEACREIFDLRRAQEWTAALSHWCDSQPGLVPYRGQCLLHRAEIMQLHGAWPDAAGEAQRACDWLVQPQPQPALGGAYYQLGEIHRLRGAFAEAEEAYRQASQWGRSPHPGLAQLRLAQEQLDAAAAAIRRVVDEAGDVVGRSKVLPAYVEVMLAVDDVGAARAGADELSEIAATLGAPLLSAVAAQAQGSVLLAEGDPRGALAALRPAWTAWQEIEAPYEAARVRVLIGLACRALGDHDTGEMELNAARSVFTQLSASPALAALEKLSQKHTGAPAGGLTGREVEVLRLVAAGKTNRAIAADLVLSEKTVARHVSNIFTKLGLSSRSAATAYAYEHDLV